MIKSSIMGPGFFIFFKTVRGKVSGVPSGKYPVKKIMINNRLYTIKSPEHERYLLNQYLDKQQAQLSITFTRKKMPSVRKKIKLLTENIKRTQTRLKKAERKKWLQRQDEELLLLLAR